MLKNQYIRYINLPKVPEELIKSIPTDPTFFNVDAIGPANINNYVWSKSHNEEINKWCQDNICSDMFWAFQLMIADLKLHKDTGTLIKMNYVISPGGDDVWTDFFADDKTTLLASYKIEPNRWHIFKADTFHQVRNVQSGLVRFGISGRIFGANE